MAQSKSPTKSPEVRKPGQHVVRLTVQLDENAPQSAEMAFSGVISSRLISLSQFAQILAAVVAAMDNGGHEH